jgi:hypothetical protein
MLAPAAPVGRDEAATGGNHYLVASILGGFEHLPDDLHLQR